jgi:redox-sensitive bicupin YhaK (pirin superfamily)
MIKIRPHTDRGLTRLPWLEGYHTFSFGRYFNPSAMGYSHLRVINDDIVAPGGGFSPHNHDNMEIITYVLEGALSHRDSLGNIETIKAGEVQLMSAGSGIEHSEFNASETDPVHLLQIWIKPDVQNTPPSYQQKDFPSRQDGWTLLVSPDGAQDSLKIKQQARVHLGRLSHAAPLVWNKPLSKSFLFIATGTVRLNDKDLVAGTSVMIENESSFSITSDHAQVLLFDLSA